MKAINLKSLWFTIETFGKKVKQWKFYLPIINLVLFVGVIGLAIVCVLLIYYPPEDTISSEKYAKETPMKDELLLPLKGGAKPIDYYDLILSNNPFSPNRTAWMPPEIKTDHKADLIREEGIAQSIETHQKPKEAPKKITLRGILILGNTRKALIENPDLSTNKKPFVFVEEGEVIAEYKVKNIEPDQIRLDWYGEEQIVIMRSSIKK